MLHHWLGYEAHGAFPAARGDPKARGSHEELHLGDLVVDLDGLAFGIVVDDLARLHVVDLDLASFERHNHMSTVFVRIDNICLP